MIYMGINIKQLMSENLQCLQENLSQENLIQENLN